MRISDTYTALLLLGMLVGCDGANPTDGKRQAVKEAVKSIASQILPDERPVVACKLDNQGQYAPDCSYEWRGFTSKSERLLVLTGPKAGFRRIAVTNKKLLIAADGSEPVRVIRQDDSTIEFAIGEAQYRLTREQLSWPQI